ncbi:MAG: hypothetical protein PHT94_00290 [Candidatus Nanoarchaeia archaeon]|nr:hypothetical protein [Candidatus Nanoarchaeia archaeon]
MIKKYLNFFWENLKISFKSLVEYKASFFAGLFTEISFLISKLIIIIIIQNIGFLPDWEIKDFLLYIVLITYFDTLSGLFLWKDDLKTILLEGEFSSYYLRPINAFINYSLRLNKYSLGFLSLDLTLLIFLFIYYKINLLNIIIMSFFSLFFLFFIILFYLFIVSLVLISFGFEKIINLTRSIDITTYSYPPIIFKNTSLKYMYIFTISFWVSFYSIEILKGNFSVLNPFVFLFLIFGIILFYFLNIIIWKHAIKKNEGYI